MKLLIVARDAAAAEAIRRAMRYAPTCRVIGWVDGRDPCAGPLVDARPDVVLVDESAGSGTVLAWAREIRAAMGKTKIVLLIREADAALVAEAEAAGVDAVIAKTASPASVGMLVREVVAGHVFRFAPTPPAAPAAQRKTGVLTARELEILGHVAAGLSNGKIASELWVTEQTVKFHLSNVYRKLGLANRTEAAHYAYLNGLVGATPPRTEVPVAAAA
jgi:DNA-binding NarL/FixJ family response regulator